MRLGTGRLPIVKYGDFKRYLCSPEWGCRVRSIRFRSGGWCERHPWGVAPMYATHHLTYQNIFNEPLGDLQAVCQECHAYLHGYLAYDPVDTCQVEMELDEAA